MIPCECHEQHVVRKIVLTGGPGAGKTAVLELVRQSLCKHMAILPETAGILFGGGFPRGNEPEQRRAVQRAIFYVQRELEATVLNGNVAIILCDRGTVDGVAYWPGPESLWDAVGTSLEDQLNRYDAVIHLRTPTENIYNYRNPLRIETAQEAKTIDDRIFDAWGSHPERFIIESEDNFVEKATRVVEILQSLMPECCRKHFGIKS
jgi:predicted ATPase